MNEYKSTLTPEEVDKALKNIAYVEAGIEAANDSAQAAAASAQAAQQAAQEALGFRTFFSAVRPDENGDLDPSRPMTTPSAASVSVKSKGDRIQSVQVDGFTTQAGSGDASPNNVREISTAGLRMVAVVFDGSSDEEWFYTPETPNFAIPPKIPSIQATSATDVYSDRYIGVPRTQLAGDMVITTSASNIIIMDRRYTNVSDFKAYLSKNPLIVWYTPVDGSNATGIYIPIQTQGHEYRCQCLELTAPLCKGDKVESCVPSGCDKTITLDGTQTFSAIGSNGCYFTAVSDAFPSYDNPSKPDPVLCDSLPQQSGSRVFGGTVGIGLSPSYSGTGFRIKIPSGENPQSFFAEHPAKVRYKSTAYTEANDKPVQLETHGFGVYVVTGQETITVPWTDENKPNLYTYRLTSPFEAPDRSDKLVCSHFKTSVTLNANRFSESVVMCSSNALFFCFDGVSTIDDAKVFFAAQYSAGTPVTAAVPLSTPAIYAHDPVTLVAVPYTEADVTAANQLANTPSTLPAIDSPDVPMLLDSADNTDSAAQVMALAANAVPVAGTYVVSSQDGTTVAVSLKAMQNGGDAATLGGQAPSSFAPASHASNGTTYGVGTATLYGHVMLSDTAEDSDATGGIAATPKCVQDTVNSSIPDFTWHTVSGSMQNCNTQYSFVRAVYNTGARLMYVAIGVLGATSDRNVLVATVPLPSGYSLAVSSSEIGALTKTSDNAVANNQAAGFEVKQSGSTIQFLATSTDKGGWAKAAIMLPISPAT